jgi:hypothetical protein
MSNVFVFVPGRDKRANENLSRFIEQCRSGLTVFGSDLDWTANAWPDPGVTFGNLEQKSRRFDPANAMKEPYLSFAKAYFRYKQGHRENRSFTEMRALRVLERALIHRYGRAKVSEIDCQVLDAAAAIAREEYSEGVAYHAGMELARLASFLSDNKLVPRLLQWVSPFRKPKDCHRTGSAARRQREEKLPDAEIIEALADIYASNPREPRDVFTTCSTALLLSAPSRITELLALEVDCEVYDTARDGSQVYGWRFMPGKDAPPLVKWIPEVIAPLAQEAIGRIREMTKEARWLASWLEDRPDEFPRHPNCPDVGEDQMLSVWEIGDALGLSTSNESRLRTDIRRLGLSSRAETTSLRSLNHLVRSLLPKDFPWFDKIRGVRYSNALFAMLDNQLDTQRRTWPVSLWKPSANILNDDLRSRPNSPSIFERHGVSISPGLKNPTTHQFRHLLNTVAQRGGLSQDEIARWSGRKEVKQNRAYDHMSEFEIVEMIRRSDSSLSKEISEDRALLALEGKVPILREELDLLLVPAAHVTEFGYCVHDYVMSPCQKFRDCLNCEEQVCIKGDHRLSRLKHRFAELDLLVRRAQEEIRAGTAGADRWYEVHVATRDRLEELISLMTATDVPDGSLIRLRSGKEFSPMKRALQARADLRLEMRSQNTGDAHG